MAEWHLYLIRCHGGNLYTGITTDVTRRFEEHQESGPKGAKYLRGRGPLELVLSRKIGSKSLALKIERKIKQLTKAQKEKLLHEKRGIAEMIKKIAI